MSNLTSGLIGTVIGAIIGFAGIYFSLYATFTIDVAVDSEAAFIEINSAKEIANTIIISDSVDVPKYQLLNLDVEWKKVIVDVGDSETAILVTDLLKLDSLRDIIISTEDLDLKSSYIEDYREKLGEIINNNMFDKVINTLLHANKNRFSSNNSSNDLLVNY